MNRMKTIHVALGIVDILGGKIRRLERSLLNAM
jgi:hypothetical protein